MSHVFPCQPVLKQVASISRARARSCCITIKASASRSSVGSPQHCTPLDHKSRGMAKHVFCPDTKTKIAERMLRLQRLKAASTHPVARSASVPKFRIPPLLCAFFVQKCTWTWRCLLLLLPQRISRKVPCPLLLKAANDALHGLFSTKTPSNPTCLLFFQATAVTTHVQKGLSLSCMTPCPAFLASSRAQMDGRRTNVCSPNLQKCSYIFFPHLRRVCKSSLLSRELFLPSFLLLSSARPKRLH